MSKDQEIAKAVAHLAANDKVMAGLIAESKEKPEFVSHRNYYQALCSSIISQQLSIKAADAIERRFKDLFGAKDYPAPELILAKSEDELKSAGLSRAKVGYIRDLASKVISGEVTFDHLEDLSNEDIIAELVLIKGVGVWTTHMFLMFCMGRLDVLASGDLGIKNGVRKLYELKRQPEAEDVVKIAKKYHWHPYESVACRYIWYSLDNKPSI